eukprot:TRINITY_DN53312_c0_g1_i1.p1 TRINITY_DN53312_c0_g1~~TRINITY_DN53312_c0_g1_i1.p1  ORF type:complete len:270 (+),score=42.13 TRINITY_DN53312_c0_g1_i1:60-812(+)
MEQQEEACAICFGPGPFETLACRCTLKYCNSCWDRAMAASAWACGHAKCPSCRARFGVDFNQASGSVIFSLSSEAPTDSRWRERLYDKVKETQICLLQAHGSELRARTSGGDCSQPHCACGAELERISGRSRIQRFLDDTKPGWRSRASADAVVRDLMSNAFLVTCDLCHTDAIREGYVWTCKNGPHTIVHPVAYDICDHCFVKYAGLHGENSASETSLLVQKCSWQEDSSALSIMSRLWNRWSPLPAGR